MRGGPCEHVAARMVVYSQAAERVCTISLYHPECLWSSRTIDSYAARLKGLFWIATFNFVFPVILNIIMIIFVFRDPNITHLGDTMVENVFADIICVILATVWCSGTYWQSSTFVGSGTGGLVRFAEQVTADSLASATFAPSPEHG